MSRSQEEREEKSLIEKIIQIPIRKKVFSVHKFPRKDSLCY
jgi:hypothetical protein